MGFGAADGLEDTCGDVVPLPVFGEVGWEEAAVGAGVGVGVAFGNGVTFGLGVTTGTSVTLGFPTGPSSFVFAAAANGTVIARSSDSRVPSR